MVVRMVNAEGERDAAQNQLQEVEGERDTAQNQLATALEHCPSPTADPTADPTAKPSAETKLF